MKKIITLFLAICMVAMTASVLVSAADTNVALGKTYTLTGVYTDDKGVVAWPDKENKKLTDGLDAKAADYNDAAYLGLNITGKGVGKDSTTNAVVKLDGSFDISKVVVKYLENKGGSGIGGPKSVEYFVSADGTTWTSIGKGAAAEDDSAVKLNANVLEKKATASYVKAVFTHSANWLFISEFEVMGTKAGGAVNPPETTVKKTNLLAKQTWKMTPVEGNDLVYTITDDGKFTGKTKDYWPDVTCEFATPIELSVADTKIAFNFTVKSGRASVRLHCADGKDIYLHQFVGKSTDLDPAGDILTAQSYSFDGGLKDLAYNIYDASVAYAGKEAFTTEKVTITGITIIVAGVDGELAIDDITIGVPSSTPATSSDTPITSDNGLIALVIISALAVAGAVIVKKSR